MNKTPSKTMFKDRNNEAGFWKKNFGEAWKAGKPVKTRVARNLSETINVRFDSHAMGVLRNHAHKKGLGVTQLIRMLVMEKL
jgi:hypothetical protein